MKKLTLKMIYGYLFLQNNSTSFNYSEVAERLVNLSKRQSKHWSNRGFKIIIKPGYQPRIIEI